MVMTGSGSASSSPAGTGGISGSGAAAPDLRRFSSISATASAT
jgi:hypothetical protein